MKAKSKTRLRTRRPRQTGDPSSERGSSRDGVSFLTRGLGDPAYDPPTPEELKMLEERVINGNPEVQDAARNETVRRSLRRLSKLVWAKTNRNPVRYQELFEQAAFDAVVASQEWDPREGPFLGDMESHVHNAMKTVARQKRKERILFCALDTTAATRREDEEYMEEENESTLPGPACTPEEKLWKTRMTLEFIEARDQLVERVQFYILNIRNIRHRTFLSMVLAHDGLANCIFPRFFEKDAKTRNYGQFHLGWYTPFLEEELGEEARRLSLSNKLRRFTNEFNYIWRYFLRDKILQDERVRVLIVRMIEIVRNDTDFRILL